MSEVSGRRLGIHVLESVLHVLLLLAGFLACLTVSSPAFSADPPPILKRGEWKAREPILDRMVAQTPAEIIIHHSGVPQNKKHGLDKKLRSLQDYSQRQKGWGDVPYHYYIGNTGQIAEARPTGYAGDTNTKYPVKDRLQIVLEGDFDKETPSAEQVASLKKLLAWLEQKHNIPSSGISAHDDHAQTNCPGKNLKALMPELKK